VQPDALRAAAAEAVGTALLLAAVVGSGIMAERLCGGNVGLALLANALATGGALLALILLFGPVSGAHFNPAVTLALAARGLFAWGNVPAFVVAQIAGGALGVWLAHLMFDLTVFHLGVKVRTGVGQWAGEITATFGLVLLILGGIHHRVAALPQAIAGYIVGAYWFTSSTSFANPAVTIARSLTDSFAGIRPADAPGFTLAQLAGMGLAVLLCRWLLPARATS
jgi:glycerol uptake facilitator-like aquaporin